MRAHQLARGQLHDRTINSRCVTTSFRAASSGDAPRGGNGIATTSTMVNRLEMPPGQSSPQRRFSGGHVISQLEGTVSGTPTECPTVWAPATC